MSDPTPIRVFIGYDSKEIPAYHVLAESILANATRSVSITPIRLDLLKSIYTRPRGSLESTEFSMTRFLVPFLCNYQGWAIFMDCDMLCRGDIGQLYAMRDGRYSVMVAKHDYAPNTENKMQGLEQTRYEKKNWSSLMLMNTGRCANLTPQYVNKASGLELHQFKWLTDDERIGDLPIEWNWLVGEYDYNIGAKLAHYTLGGPWWEEYVHADYADEWRTVHSRLIS